MLNFCTKIGKIRYDQKSKNVQKSEQIQVVGETGVRMESSIFQQKKTSLPMGWTMFHNQNLKMNLNFNGISESLLNLL